MSQIRHRLLKTSLAVHFSSSFTTSAASKPKIPLLYKSPKINDESPNSVVTLQIHPWGRGASGQLGGGIKEIRLYPAPVANLLLPPRSYSLFTAPGQLITQLQEATPHSVGIGCGLFHSGLVLDETLWIWGKGDGGRLGFGHENPSFLPTLNPYLDSVRSIALGGMHSVALTSQGEVFTCSVASPDSPATKGKGRKKMEGEDRGRGRAEEEGRSIGMLGEEGQKKCPDSAEEGEGQRRKMQFCL